MKLSLLALRLEPLRDRPAFWAAVLASALVAATAFAASIGAAQVPLSDLPGAFARADHPMHALLWQVRLPRIAAGALVGAALGVGGALLQAVVRNPLADPGLIGVTAGAGLAALLAIVLMPEATLSLPFLAFGGGAAALVALLSAGWSGTRPGGPLRIILSGVALQAIFFGAISLVLFFFADRAPAFVSFVVGSLNGLGWRDVTIVAIPTAIGVGLSLLVVRPLNLLLLDDATAGGVGLSVRRARLAAASLAAFLAAGAVSVAGLVGFVGLVVPNWTRLVAGPDHRVLLPLAALGGAALVVAADTAGRTVAPPLELPVGALLALIGGPYFLIVLWRKLG